MNTAVDTNILLDLHVGDDVFSQMAKAEVSRAYAHGSLVICTVAYAETAVAFSSKTALDAFLERLEVQAQEFEAQTCFAAGQMHKRYRAQGGKRERILADFMIGAHAMLQADQLLTRDRGFFRKYFPELRIVDPTKRLK